ncbi:MAG: aldehyde ferredoxin oxidoreductase C-terminal domain-containing protein [Dehalococcoidia bacterium]|nr:aldehyde ferredoxin oxidoreductase C-terminal domain-containing protein [Dehalococcoidia bacterium]
MWGDGCAMCPLRCKVPFMRRDGPLGPKVGEFRHDSAGGWSQNVLLKGGFDTQTYLSPYVDNLGMDNEDVSGVVAWMMECYDRGLITKEDLGGIDLTWGNLEAICQLLERIVKREGIGDTLAEGLKFAPPKIGKGTEKYAMHSKGVAITSYELRGRLSDAVSMVVNACGGLHADRGGPLRIIADCLTICNFHRGPLTDVFGSFPDWGVEMLNAVCGWNITKQDWDDFTSRAHFMERCYAIRDGYLPSRDDTIPDRFFDETIYHKYGQPMKLDRKEFLEQRRILYEAYGLNQDGIPPQASLKKLGLDFVIPTLEKVIGRWT